MSSLVQVAGMEGDFINTDTVWKGSTKVIGVYSLTDNEIYFVNPVDIIELKHNSYLK